MTASPTASPEPATSAEDLPPQDDPDGEEFVRPVDVLAFVRQEAARRDPGRSHLYARMSAARAKDGVDVVLHLLKAHRELLDHRGKRAHSRRVYELLATTNTASLVLAEAYLEAAYGVLPPSPPPQHND